MGLCHEPIFQVLLYVSKAYDSLDIGRFMEILRGYGIKPNLQILLHRLWDEQVVVPKAGTLFERPFGTERGVPQGDPVSPAILNIVVDTEVRAALVEGCGPQ